MINVSNIVREAYQKSTTQVDKIIFNNKEYRIKNVQYYDDCYDEGNIFGTAIARCVEFEIENSIDLEKKEFEYLTGVIIEGKTYWISLGNFITQDVEANDTTGVAKIMAIDYMLKSNIKYKTNLNYSSNKITLLQVLQEACNQAGLVLATLDFANKDFIVDSNQFTEDTLIRQVLQAVAQLSGTFAKIKSDNKLYFITPKKETATVKTIDEMTVYEVDNWIIGKSYSNNCCNLSDYKELELKRQTHPINVVSLGMADIEGENITLRDEENIKKNGENILRINDNPFAYTQAKREQLITALFETVKGFEYTSYEIKGQSKPYLETGDEIIVIDKNGNRKETFLFRFNYKSPNGLESEMSAPSIIKATVAYQNVPSALDIARRTEIIVDKQNQKIEALITNNTEMSEKTAKLEMSVEQLQSQIGDVADVTTTIDGYGTVTAENINKSEPIMLKVHPVEYDITSLKPKIALYPKIRLYSHSREIYFKNTTTNETIIYNIPCDLYVLDDVYDEFVLDYANNKCYVTHNIEIVNGTKQKRTIPTTEKFIYPTIDLANGNYIITIPSSGTAYIYARLMVQNIYTDQFATKVEMNTKITQTTSSIKAEVNKTLETYPTNQEMKSAIELKADSITSNVSKSFSTKNETADAKAELEGNINKVKKDTDDKFKNYSTTTQMNSAIQQKADSITSTVESKITTAVNNIEIGGRNLVLNSDNYIQTSSTTNTSKTFQFNIEEFKKLAGKKIVMSMDIELKNAVYNSSATANKRRIVAELSIAHTDGTTQYCDLVYNLSSTAETSKKRISTLIQISNKEIKSVTAKTIGIYVQGLGSGTVKAGRLKVELGNKATDWTPAPEDTENQLTITEQKVTKIEQNLDSITQSVTAIKDNTVENIVNGDFKNNFNNWTKLSSGIMEIKTINNVKWLHMEVYAIDVPDYIQQKITTLIENTQYKLAFNAYHATNSNGVINADVEFYNSSNTLLSKKGTSFHLSSSEQSYNWEFSTPNTFEYAILKFWAIGYPDKEIYLKDVSIIGGALWQRVTELQISVDGVKSEVKEKVGNEEIISKINQSSEAVGINANKIELSANDILNLLAGNTINLSSKNIVISSTNFSVDKNGNLDCSNAKMNNVTISGGKIALTDATGVGDEFQIITKNNENERLMFGSSRFIMIPNIWDTSHTNQISMSTGTETGEADITVNGLNYQYTRITGAGITTPKLTETSLESEKKNFEKLEKALDIIKNVDIYKYNLKSEEDSTKKHIGFVIGDNYNYSKELTSNKNDGVDIYSLASCCLAGIKEQQKQIEDLKNRIENLSEEVER